MNILYCTMDTKSRIKYNRTCVARGHMRELAKKGVTIVKDSAVMDILQKLSTDSLVIEKINGVTKYVVPDPSSCYCCQRKLIRPVSVQRMLHKNRISGVKEELIPILLREFDREPLTRSRIENIFSEHYTYAGVNGAYVRDWTYKTIWYKVTAHTMHTMKGN